MIALRLPNDKGKQYRDRQSGKFPFSIDSDPFSILHWFRPWVQDTDRSEKDFLTILHAQHEISSYRETYGQNVLLVCNHSKGLKFNLGLYTRLHY